MTDEETPVLKLAISLDYQSWMVPEVLAYRKAVGANPDYAAAQISNAFSRMATDAAAEFGADVDAPGWEPPAGWVPPSLVSIDPTHLLGFVWIPARRESPDLTLDEFAATVPYGALLAAFWEYMNETVEESAAAAPLATPNRATRRASGQRSRTASPSRTRSAGRSATSTASRSKSSPPPSDSTTS